MRRLLSFLLFSFAAAAQPGGWTDIFPDAKFSQWTRIAIPPTGKLDPVTQWKIEGRTLVCEGNRGHEMLRYNREFGDFVMQTEWRFIKSEGEPKYNSGIFIRNDEMGNIWHQAQTGLAGGYLFGNTLVDGKPGRVNLRDKMKENRVKPAGEWNAYEITCRGRTISLAVNGETVNEFTQCDVPKGYVGLEAEGFRIEFRNIRVKPLK